MRTVQLNAVVRRLRGIADPDVEPTDRQLLQAFATSREPDAFAAIVRRHGPMVLGVLRRALGNEQDAEDGFQATFLVLARSAAAVRDGQALSCWLHGVSRRIAMKAKRDAARRRAREGRAARPDAAPANDIAWSEVQAALDDEIQRLPAIYRDPFILCCLEGLGRVDAAERLHIKEGTLSSRLAKARELLKERLGRRGVTLAAFLGALAISDGQAISADHAEATASLVSQTLAGPAAVSPGALALANGVMRSVGFTAARAFTALVLIVGMIAAGVGLASDRPANAQPAKTPESAKASPAPAREKPEDVDVAGRVVDPAGKPVAGAEILLWTNDLKKRDDAKVRATAGKDGSFRLTVPAADRQRGPKLVATAEGLGPDWLDVPAAPDGVLTLRLAKDDVPVDGQVLDLEGR